VSNASRPISRHRVGGREYLEVVKTYGKWVTIRATCTRSRIFRSACSRPSENVDGKYWFPSYSRSDDTLNHEGTGDPRSSGHQVDDFNPFPAPRKRPRRRLLRLLRNHSTVATNPVHQRSNLFRTSGNSSIAFIPGRAQTPFRGEGPSTQSHARRRAWPSPHLCASPT